MRNHNRPLICSCGCVVAAVTLLFAGRNLCAQNNPTTNAAASAPPARGGFGGGNNSGTEKDHQNMMDQLGIKQIRGGKDGNNPNSPNAANTDESEANPFPNLPDPLVLKNGTRVTTPDMWWNQRRPEIVEDFDREIYGRVPANMPKVTWEVTSTTTQNNGTVPVITKQLVGHVDNSSYPEISVNIQVTLSTPADASGPVPVMMVFSGGGFGGGGVGGGRGGFGGGGFGGPLTADQTTKLNGGITAAQADLVALQDKLTAAQKDAVTAVLAKQDDASIQAKLEAVAMIQTDIAMLRYSKGVSVIAPLITDAQKTNISTAPGQIYTTFFAAPPPAGGGGAGGAVAGRGAGGGGFGGGGASAESQVLAKGWGYATINTGSVQADNGAGLTAGGIIGLVNKGQYRKPDDWGVLRAWAWGASRALDYFESDNAVDAKQVGLEGHSRWGKATIVAMAYDQRFAIAYVSSSGEGGAKLYRRNWGEAMGNVAGSGEYHWMAGNFIKYDGPLNEGDLPVDAHELVAMCAPRPVFISGGATQGDGWVDAKGMFMAAAAAQPVYTLLGKKDTGTTEFPPMETPLIDGDIAFRQHSQGHTDVPNWPTFIQFASRYLKAPDAAAVPAK